MAAGVIEEAAFGQMHEGESRQHAARERVVVHEEHVEQLPVRGRGRHCAAQLVVLHVKLSQVDPGADLVWNGADEVVLFHGAARGAGRGRGGGRVSEGGAGASASGGGVHARAETHILSTAVPALLQTRSAYSSSSPLWQAQGSFLLLLQTFQPSPPVLSWKACHAAHCAAGSFVELPVHAATAASAAAGADWGSAASATKHPSMNFVLTIDDLIDPRSVSESPGSI